MAVKQPIVDNQPQSASASPYATETSQEYAAKHRRRVRRVVGWGLFLTLLLGIIMLVAGGNIAVPISIFVFCGIVALMVQFPTAILPLTLVGACVCEQYALGFKDSLTDRVPLFWDINTVVQIYARQDFHDVPFNIFEILFATSMISWFIRGIYDQTLRVTWGRLALPILGYMLCVCYGVVNGILSGGDYHIALFEARPQLYLFLAYIMALNSGQTAARQMRSMLWISATCIGIKAVLLTFRFFVTLGGHTVPETGVGSHEESFFFDAYFVMLAVLWMGGLEPKLQKFMLFLLPFVVISDLANERRAATAALVIAVPVLLGLSYIAFANRRSLILKIVVAITVISAVYFPIYWNKDGVLAQPARALKSQFAPDARDESSDVYRLAEDANLMYTMRTSPIIGYGYGRPIILYTSMVDLTNIDPLIMYRTHNQILWVWMRLGSIGFFFFWIMIAAILMRAAQAIRFPEPGLVVDARFERQKVALAVYAATLTVMLLLFGLFDMQLSSVRDMLFVGFWIGMFCAYLGQNSAARVALPYYWIDHKPVFPVPSRPLLQEGSPR